MVLPVEPLAPTRRTSGLGVVMLMAVGVRDSLMDGNLLYIHLQGSTRTLIMYRYRERTTLLNQRLSRGTSGLKNCTYYDDDLIIHLEIPVLNPVRK